MKQTNVKKTFDEGRFAIPRRNVLQLLIGLAVVAVGFIFLAGGKSSDPAVFNEDGLFSVTRMVVAPLLICGGFVYEIVAIMRIRTPKQ